MRRALGRAPVDLLATGDYQPTERKFELSRRILEVCLELGFPVSVLERSPLVLRDLDLPAEINQRSRTVMMWSIIYMPDSVHRATLRRLERLAPYQAGERKFGLPRRMLEVCSKLGFPVLVRGLAVCSRERPFRTGDARCGRGCSA